MISHPGNRYIKLAMTKDRGAIDKDRQCLFFDLVTWELQSFKPKRMVSGMVYVE